MPAAFAAETATSPTRSLAGDVGEALRKRVAEGVGKALRERASEYQPLVDQWRKRSTDELQKIGQWEYQVIAAHTSKPEELTALLNQWGERGWECFQVTSAAPASAGRLPGEHLLFLRKRRGPMLERLPMSEFLKLMIYYWARRSEVPPASPTESP